MDNNDGYKNLQGFQYARGKIRNTFNKVVGKNYEIE